MKLKKWWKEMSANEEMPMMKRRTSALASLRAAALESTPRDFEAIVNTPNNLWKCPMCRRVKAELGISFVAWMPRLQEKELPEKWKWNVADELIEKIERIGEGAIALHSQGNLVLLCSL